MSANAFAGRVLIVLGFVLLALLFWRLRDAFLLTFGGVLLAIGFCRAAGWTARRTGLGYGWALAIVLAVLASALAGLAAGLGAPLVAQSRALWQSFADGLKQLRDQLNASQLGDLLPQDLGNPEQLFSWSGSLVSIFTGTLTAAITVATTVLAVIAIAVFAAASPALYRKGLLKVTPPAQRPHMRRFLDEGGATLGNWLVGVLVAMVAVAVLTGLGLTLAGVPLALVLGVIAGLLDFIPFIGPIIAAVPAILVAFTVSPLTALYALAVFVVVQQIEGNILQPLIQRRTVAMPPVLAIVGVIAGGLLFGPAGLLLGAPLTVLTIQAVRIFYVEGVLGDDTTG